MPSSKDVFPFNLWPRSGAPSHVSNAPVWPNAPAPIQDVSLQKVRQGLYRWIIPAGTAAVRLPISGRKIYMPLENSPGIWALLWAGGSALNGATFPPLSSAFKLRRGSWYRQPFDSGSMYVSKYANNPYGPTFGVADGTRLTLYIVTDDNVDEDFADSLDGGAVVNGWQPSGYITDWTLGTSTYDLSFDTGTRPHSGQAWNTPPAGSDRGFLVDRISALTIAIFDGPGAVVACDGITLTPWWFLPDLTGAQSATKIIGAGGTALKGWVPDAANAITPTATQRIFTLQVNVVSGFNPPGVNAGGAAGGTGGYSGFLQNGDPDFDPAGYSTPTLVEALAPSDLKGVGLTFVVSGTGAGDTIVPVLVMAAQAQP